MELVHKFHAGAAVFIPLFDETTDRLLRIAAADSRRPESVVRSYPEPKKLGQPVAIPDSRGFTLAIIAGEKTRCSPPASAR